MARTYREIGVTTMVMLVVMVGRSNADVNKDKEECTSQLTGLATCLPYVGGQAKAPTLDCCTGLKQVLKDSKKCLCILVKDRNDPSIGLKFNASLALSLPRSCHAPQNISISECLQLLKLAPNSPEAKAFADFAKDAAPSSSPTSSSAGKSSDSGSGTGTSSGKVTSEGGGKHKYSWLAATTVMLYGSLLLFPVTMV